MHARIVRKQHPNVIRWSIEVFARKFKSSCDHAPEELAKHIDVKVGVDSFKTFAQISPLRHIVSWANLLICKSEPMSGFLFRVGDQPPGGEPSLEL